MNHKITAEESESHLDVIRNFQNNFLPQNILQKYSLDLVVQLER